MAYFSKLTQVVFFAAALPVGLARAQAPVINAMQPLANAVAVPPAATVSATFSQPLTPASATALQVFSSQRGGRRTSGTPATVAGSALQFAPAAYSFQPGEIVSYTVTTAAASSKGGLQQPKVGQFTVAAGPGTGSFGALRTVLANYNPQVVQAADVDGDGDLDLLATSYLGYVTVLLNNGRAEFTKLEEVAVGYKTSGLAVGDVDDDGDLDFLTISTFDLNGGAASGSVSIRLNDGTGHYGAAPDAVVGAGVSQLALGDWDGDGDLDLATTGNQESATAATTVSIRFNNGRGIYSGNQEVLTGGGSFDLKAGDFDNDGDLDLVTTTTPAIYIAPSTASQVNVLANDGHGTFVVAQQLPNAGKY